MQRQGDTVQENGTKVKEAAVTYYTGIIWKEQIGAGQQSY
jgi:hypothetical protein